MTIRFESLARTVLAIPLLWITASCGGDGGSSRSTPTAPTVPPPAASTAVGNYKTSPCCCRFWTATLTRAGQTDTWTCWGWIEIRAQSGSQVSGLTDMERGDSGTCNDDQRCANGSVWSSGEIDATGAITWRADGATFIANRVADQSGCTVASGGDTFTGALVGDTLTVTNGWVLSCSGKTAQLTLSGRGNR